MPLSEDPAAAPTLDHTLVVADEAAGYSPSNPRMEHWLGPPKWSAPATAPAFGQFGLYIGNADGRLHRFDPDDGGEVWSIQLGAHHPPRRYCSRDRAGRTGRWKPRGGGRTVIRAPQDFASSHVRLATPARTLGIWVGGVNPRACRLVAPATASIRVAVRAPATHRGACRIILSPAGGMVDLDSVVALPTAVYHRSSSGIWTYCLGASTRSIATMTSPNPSLPVTARGRPASTRIRPAGLGGWRHRLPSPRRRARKPSYGFLDGSPPGTLDHAERTVHRRQRTVGRAAPRPRAPSLGHGARAPCARPFNVGSGTSYSTTRASAARRGTQHRSATHGRSPAGAPAR